MNGTVSRQIWRKLLGSGGVLEDAAGRTHPKPVGRALRIC